MGMRHRRGQGSERHLLKVNMCVCAWLRFGDAMLIRITIQTRSENITLGDWALGTGCQGNYVHCITLLGGYGNGTVLKSKPSAHHRT